jgi:hypothetical protein
MPQRKRRASSPGAVRIRLLIAFIQFWQQSRDSLMPKRTVVACLLLLSALLGGAASVQAQDDGTLSLAATAGYDGYYKEGEWVPVHVAAANRGAPVEGTLRVVTGSNPNDRVVYTSPLSLPTQSDKRVTFYVFLTGFASDLEVELLDEGGDLVASAEARLRRLGAQALLYGVVSDEPVALDHLENVRGSRREAAVAYLDVTQLPDIAPALGALDILVFAGADSGRLAPEQRTALDAWVDLGGLLVVSGGSRWQQASAAFAGELPVTPSGSRTVDDLPGLRRQTGSAFRDAGPYLVTESSLRAGDVLLHEEGLPLLARVKVGRGGYYFLALDPNAPPLLDWAGSADLWSRVAQGLSEAPYWTQGPRNSYTAGQAIGSLTSLVLPSTIWLLLFVLFYIIAIGPVNYLILRRLGRRELAWISIPAIVLFFTGIAYLTGFRLRGNDVIVNQMAVASGHVDGDQMRVSSLLGLYSPSRSTYDVQLPPDVLVRPFNRITGNMSGGGVLAGAGNLQSVERSSGTMLRRVRVDVSGMETFVANSVAPLPAISGEASLHLAGNGGELEVHVQNNDTITLENAGLLFGPLFVRLGDLEPGASRTETQRLSSRQAAAAAGSASTMPGPIAYVGAAPLNSFYADLLGTSTYYNDPDAFPRFQLLESLAGYNAPYGGSGAVYSNQSSLFLVGWGETPYVDVELGRPLGEHPATTFYILEIPVTDFSASGKDVEVPLEMMSWQVRNQNGVYTAGISDFYMSFGWVEFEYEPWPLFQDMEITELTLVLQVQGSTSSQTPPEVALWDWHQESWVEVPDVVWGRITIADFDAFLNGRNQIRVRLQNNTADVNIRLVYPSLSGNLE